MEASVENKPVTVDPGDLSEALQAATAWAGFLRNDKPKMEDADEETRARYSAAADRIDAAAHRLRSQSYESGT